MTEESSPPEDGKNCHYLLLLAQKKNIFLGESSTKKATCFTLYLREVYKMGFSRLSIIALSSSPLLLRNLNPLSAYTRHISREM